MPTKPLVAAAVACLAFGLDVAAVHPDGQQPQARFRTGVNLVVVDVSVFDRTETLEAGRFGSARAADYRLALPLSELEEGEHLLTIDAARVSGSTVTGAGNIERPVRREVRFGVRQ